MMPEKFNIRNSLLSHWTTDLIGTSSSFSFNLIVHITAGLLFSFKVLTTPYLLLLFGVISPILFTLCLYSIIRNGTGQLFNEPLPSTFISRSGNRVLMTFDICLIIGFALLIYFGPLNYFLFRFLQTVFFPCMMLVLLRLVFLSSMIERYDNEDERMI
ncbi:MAG: hypothetical protein EHM93_14785 [Bacteroidales bacterium]|nr:MAG: hypothetical protein EHM93_14785 [Bacteroidales bacterium]